MFIDLRLKLWLPSAVAHFAVQLLLLYRRIHYGYPFRRIPLTQGKFAIVDPEDYAWLSQYKWQARKDGPSYYAARTFNINGKKFNRQMHREIILRHSPDACSLLNSDLVVDHINNNGLDNRKVNLRIVTQRQNCWNSRAKFISRSSRYKGVSWHSKMRKWVSKISIDGKSVHLGYFDNEIAAAKAYDAAAKKHRGQYAYLNFPQRSQPYAVRFTQCTRGPVRPPQFFF